MPRRLHLALLLALLLSLLLLPACARPQAVGVVRVIDGDTIVIQGGEKVRYIGINAPEMDTAWGEAARQQNLALVNGKRLRLEKDISNRDRYGRLLCYVYAESLFVNAELVRLGYARARAYPPDTRYRSYLEEMEREARAAGRGMWAR